MTKLEALIQLRDNVKSGRLPIWPVTSLAVGAWPGHDVIKAYIGSLDAAKALHEAVLPGWKWSLSQNIHHGTQVARVYRIAGDEIEEHAATDALARAWLLAILEALISQETGT